MAAFSTATVGERTGRPLVAHDCEYQLVDSCPHDYRIAYQPTLEDARRSGYYGLRERTAMYGDVADMIAADLRASGATYVSVLPPRCTVVVWDVWGYVERDRA